MGSLPSNRAGNNSASQKSGEPTFWEKVKADQAREQREHRRNDAKKHLREAYVHHLKILILSALVFRGKKVNIENVMNMTWGPPDNDQSLKRLAVAQLVEEGLIFVKVHDVDDYQAHNWLSSNPELPHSVEWDEEFNELTYE
jgi:hypothetical protein